MSWKNLIDLGVFDECFPQRINASFRYLTQNSANESFFLLKHLIDKGDFVVEYLSIGAHGSKNRNFMYMDLFRSYFDRSACGYVDIDNFVLGIIDKLLELK